ncbi:MAG: 6-phosphofructokinase, partial [Armatimonadota bacterium]
MIDKQPTTLISDFSALDRARMCYQPRLPKVLQEGDLHLETREAPSPAQDTEAIAKDFPLSINKPLVHLAQGTANLTTEAITVGVVFSGGQAPGGHNVISGLLDALLAANPGSHLLGFLGGPIGVVNNEFIELTSELVNTYRNTGGFDMIGSGRDKIEKSVDLAACVDTLKNNNCRALVVIGGDDSNTNAAVMAEYFLSQQAGIQVIGVPKTIDGDMKNEYIETSFGFDTAAKVYSELVGSICRDSASARKYWHFVRLMGRAASHVTLEVGLQVQPSLTIISEEAEQKGWTLAQVTEQIAT